MGPSVTPFEFDESVYSGDEVKVLCHVAKGDEPVAIGWTRNGAPLRADPAAGVQLQSVGGKTSLLTLTNVGHNSDGEYRCTAYNAAGVAWHAANLTVYGKGPQRSPDRTPSCFSRRSLAVR